MENTITIKCKGDFNAGWLWSCMGMDLPNDASEAFKEGFDTATETPSLETVRFVMKGSQERGHYTVQRH